MDGKNITEKVRGFSLAMYSTWLWHRPTHSMFDAGEGISLNMQNYVFAIDNIFISHGHHDHIGGIAGLALARGSARGDKEKPFSIYYPRGWDNIEALKTYIRNSSRGMKYELRWVEVEPDQDIQVDNAGKVFIRPFRVNHSRNLLCLGYAMIEKRHKLRSHLVGKTGNEIAMIRRSEGMDAVTETFEKIIIAYSGDTAPVRPMLVKDADVLFHEATFVGEKDMDISGGHSSVREAINTAAYAHVKSLVLYHLSSRYSVDQAIAEAKKAIAYIHYEGAVSLLVRDRVFKIQESI